MAVLDALVALEGRLASRQNAPQGSAEAVGRIRAAASLATGIRETLASVPRPRRQAGRALRQCGELERAIALALEALGETPRLLEPPQASVSPVADAAGGYDEFEDDALVAEHALVDGAVEESAAQFDTVAAETDRFPRAVMLVNGEALDLTDEHAAAPLAASPSPSPAAATRPVMPKAWTPGLLESLSEEEKAILFA
ncbi:hypothetical protein [Hansschlegelia zhihuaiae]|uniref:Uncharacterized protein n=1 Tax=Hansschlegelia zhihuaiae TaxID=405005 RepID=A0A4Q0MMH7_9HYPH|nr:hypothetical protein [Hansschlegelia zhihuaiae]RXF74991.1 hypothetical protein EK403_02750 [Hansschlegelia zhihuaiae]